MDIVTIGFAVVSNIDVSKTFHACCGSVTVCDHGYFPNGFCSIGVKKMFTVSVAAEYCGLGIVTIGFVKKW